MPPLLLSFFLRVAREALDAIAGSEEDGAALLRDLAGFENHTTDALLEAYRVAGDGKSARSRGIKAALLYPLRKLGRAKAMDLGFKVGKNMWKTAVKFRPGCGRDAADGRIARSGRTLHCKAPEIAQKWEEVSHLTSAGGRVFYGPKRRAADDIAKEVGGVTGRTVLNLKPEGVTNAARPTDLCPICEELKRRRLGAANRPESTQTHGRGCSGHPADPGAITILEMHEALAKAQKAAYTRHMMDPPDNSLSVLIDWSGAVEARSFRNTTLEFHSPIYMQMIGTWASFRDRGGEVRRKYFHGYDKAGVARSKDGGWVSEAALYMVGQACEWYGGIPNCLNIWFDTAQHFRNKVVLYEVPTALAGPWAKRAELNFHAEHHGKTGLDGSFRRAKARVRELVDLAEIKAGVQTMEEAILVAYQKANEGTVEEYGAVFLPAPTGRPKRQLRIREVRKINRITTDATGDFTVTYANGSRVGPRKLSTDVPRAQNEKKAKENRLLTEPKSYVEQIRKKSA